jgi:hypothetical protein
MASTPGVHGKAATLSKRLGQEIPQDRHDDDGPNPASSFPGRCFLLDATIHALPRDVGPAGWYVLLNLAYLAHLGYLQ